MGGGGRAYIISPSDSGNSENREPRAGIPKVDWDSCKTETPKLGIPKSGIPKTGIPKAGIKLADSGPP